MLKSRFFHSWGFDEATFGLLEQQFLALAHSTNVKEVAESAYISKFIMVGYLQTPMGLELPGALFGFWSLMT
jgi:hypothetical protein